MEKPKILLLSLKSSTKFTEYDENLFEFKSRQRLWNTPNLGLLTVGAILGDRYDSDYIDLNYEEITDLEYEYVFMSPSTSQALQAYELADRFRHKGIKVVMGGPHVSMLPEEAKEHADVVFVGESEDTLQMFMEEMEEKIYYVQQNPSISGDMKVPLYHLAEKYPYSSVPVQLSRGCPHQCEFCLSSTIYGRRLCKKTIEQVEKELSCIAGIYKKPYIFFTDDNFLFDTNYAIQVMEVLKKYHFSWYAFTDISVYKKEDIIGKLFDSGCRKLLIGFESLNKDNLNSINKSGFKSSKRDEYMKAVEVLQRRNIGIVGSFVMGLEHDTLESFDELYQFIYDSGVYGTNITIATPFPGTRFFERLSREQRIASYDWSEYDGFTLLYKLPNIEADEFMNKYWELINKVNSKERFRRIFEFYKMVR